MTADRRPSSLDVARLAGVSASAVSRAFTPGASVSATTRGKVRAAAEELGYQPNALPRMLLTARSGLVALIMGELANPFYPEVQRLFLEALQARGLRALLFALEPGGGVDDALREVLRYRVDGVIVTSAAISPETAAACGRMRTPVVLFNRTLHEGGAGTCSVCCDNVEAGRLVANLLLDAGHRRPAFVSGDLAASTNADRETGFVGRLGERGVRDVPRAGEANSYEAGRAGALALFPGRGAVADRPDALFCASDVVALGALDALRHELGLRVPEDVSVVGFDDVPMAGWASYRLTTVRQRRRRMVDRAVAMLLARLEEGAGRPRIELVPGRLVVRSSARVPGGVPEAAGA